MQRQKTGISLIVLVITIIIMIILASTIIISLSNNGIIDKANKAKFKNDVKTMQEELTVLNANNILVDNKTSITIDDLKSSKNYRDKFIIYDGILKYNTSKLTSIEEAIVKELGIEPNVDMEQVIADLFSVAQTYRNNVSKLEFGSLKTAYDETTENQIDCSSFLQLVLQGIPYEQSKYNSKDSNVQTYDYGIKLPDNPYGERRWLANDIAHYAYDNNYAFVPNDDVTNVKPGDIIFFSTNGGSSEYFMGITHAAIVVDRLEGDKLLVFHGNNTNTVGMQIINLFTEENNNGYCNGAILIARFPFKSTSNELNKNNLIINGTESVLNHNGQSTTCLKTLNLSESLKSNTAYTLMVNMSLGTEEYSDIFPAFVANSYSQANKITEYTYSWVDDGKYLVHFVTNDTVTVNNIKIYMLSKSNVANKYRNGSFYSAKLYEGMLTEEEINTRQNF